MIRIRFHPFVRGLNVLTILFALASSARADGPIPVGSRREVFVDHHLIERLDDARLELHRPQAREVAIVHDQPWEGNTCFYHSVFRDGDVYRMYYRGSHHVPGQSASHQTVCYAESKDGTQWTKPKPTSAHAESRSSHFRTAWRRP